MSDFTRISRMLSRTPVLLADGETGDVRLITEPQAMARVQQGDRAVLMANIGRSIGRFADLHGVGTDDRIFKRTDLAKVSGMAPTSISYWLKEGIFEPSVKASSEPGRGNGAEFSWADLFAAAVMGMASRQGTPVSVLRKIQSLFCEKRTAEKVTTSRQS